MKKGVLFGVVCAALLFISTFAACNSNEEPVMDFDTDEISAKIITDKDEILAVYDSAFDFLSGSRSIPQSVSHAGNLSTKYSDEILQKSSWDLSKVTKVNLGGAISVVAIPATMGAGAIFSVCWSVATDIACV